MGLGLRFLKELEVRLVPPPNKQAQMWQQGKGNIQNSKSKRFTPNYFVYCGSCKGPCDFVFVMNIYMNEQ